LTRTVLFLCTGNYYRSRFAELFFNSLASRSGLAWTATSRGIATEFGFRNVGPISSHTLKRLQALGIEVEPDIRPPIQLEERDLAQSDLIIALNEPEHRPFLEMRFPKWVERVEYWHVPDLDLMSANDALLEMEREVRSLVRQL
jgi:low molecular weight protein-tyrosine phosphatase